MDEKLALADALKQISNELSGATIVVQGTVINATSQPHGGNVTGLNVVAQSGSGSGNVIGFQSTAGEVPDQDARDLAVEFATIADAVESGEAEPSKVYELLGAVRPWVGRVVDAASIQVATDLVGRALGG